MNTESPSQSSLIKATRSRAKFSGHGSAKGAAGYVSDTDDSAFDFLGVTGQIGIFNPQKEGFGKIRVGAAWQNVLVQESGFFGKIFKKVQKQGVDIDLGCLYELQNGHRGCLQAFGEYHGNYEEEPFLLLSRDDRTGDDHDDDDGEDEILLINGQQWPAIKRVLIYLYIYGGAQDWAQVRPQIQIRVPGEKPMLVTLHTYKKEMALCAVAGLENERDGIKLVNYTEYYHGHAEMDRAFGFGIEWADGQKS